jgi:AcrR family transcriptional regulator
MLSASRSWTQPRPISAAIGYGKTTVADLAKAIGFSKAYIYKFFDSKQAIGRRSASSAWTRSRRRPRPASPTARKRLRSYVESFSVS